MSELEACSPEQQAKLGYYDDEVTRSFIFFAFLWGAVGMLVGVLIAFQLAFPELNFGTKWTSFSHLRPIHTNAVIFGFTGNALFAAMFYSTQRLCRVSMWSKTLSQIQLWGWQLIIVLVAVTLAAGYSQSREYAEAIWPIDILITVVWVIFAINYFMTLYNRRQKHMYVAIWFYISFIIGIAVLHIVNNIQLPVSWTESYPVFAGVQDALVQWWYGHNAVAFFLTFPILGAMYYFLPKSINRPIYSYRLSILHFWSLIFLYVWAGPHHLLYTSLPNWVQSLGVVFSLMLIAPSWGGMYNGLATYTGAWDQVRKSAIAKFFIISLTGYGMATFEGPMLSIPGFSRLMHYTDWIVAHVHIGALAWVGCMFFAIFYWLVPRLYGTTLYSEEWANTHFWMATVGIVLYAGAMYTAAVIQGIYWRAFTEEGLLAYDFMESVNVLHVPYVLRGVGGLLYLLGLFLMVHNLRKTVQQGSPIKVPVPCGSLGGEE